MSDQSPSPSPNALTESSGHWAARSHLLSACLVTLNILLILLIYFYFWRMVWHKRAASAARTSPTDDDVSSVATSPEAVSPRIQNRCEFDQIVASLPVFVHSSDKVECAVCITEFKDGDNGRLLPRCGHRFHIGCVDMWFQFHTTCPLCRASVVAAAESESVVSDMNTDFPV